MIFTSNVRHNRGLSAYDIGMMARNEPDDFIKKIQAGVESGSLKLSKLSNIRALYENLCDVPVNCTMEIAGKQRAITAAAFPIMTGELVVAQLNEAYNQVPTVGQELVYEFEDSKKVTTFGSVEAADKHVSEVKEGDDFPEIHTGEKSYEIRHKRNGRKFTITAEAIEENNLPDIVNRLNVLGEIANDWIEEQTLERVFDYYGSRSSDSEPYVYRPGGTGTSLYSATANTPGTLAPSGTQVQGNQLADYTDLDNAREVLNDMRNSRGKRINIPWSEVVLVIPTALQGIAFTILNSQYLPGGSHNDINTYGPMGKWPIPAERVISSPKIDDISTSAWYLGVPKRQFKRKWKLRMEYVTLGTDTQAYLNSRVAFQSRIAWDVEVGATDYRYFIQNLSGTSAPYDE